MSSYLSELNRHYPQDKYNEERVYSVMQNILRDIVQSPNPSMDHELPRTAITDMVRQTRAKRASKERRECARVIASLHSAF